MPEKTVRLDTIFHTTWDLGEVWSAHVNAAHLAHLTGRTPESREDSRVAKLRYDGALTVLAAALTAAGEDISPNDSAQTALAKTEALLEEWATARGLI